MNDGTYQCPTRSSTTSNFVSRSRTRIGNSPQLLSYQGTTALTMWILPPHHLIQSLDDSSSCAPNFSKCSLPWSHKSNPLTQFLTQCCSPQCISQWPPAWTRHPLSPLHRWPITGHTNPVKMQITTEPCDSIITLVTNTRPPFKKNGKILQTLQQARQYGSALGQKRVWSHGMDRYLPTD